MANIIFDFDGTIAESLPVVVMMLNQWRGDDGPIQPSEVERLRNLHLREILAELHIAPWQAPQLLVKGRLEMTKHIDTIKPVGGITESIKKLTQAGNTLYIMSSNSSKNIRQFLKKHDLHNYFKRVYGGIGILGKTTALKKILRDNNLSRAHTFYIGDETRDIRAAKKAGVEIIAVSWGYNGEEILSSATPNKVVSKPSELTKVLSVQH